jgi:hypothetical protein
LPKRFHDIGAKSWPFFDLNTSDQIDNARFVDMDLDVDLRP